MAMRLNDELNDTFRLTEAQKNALKKLGVRTAKDLLYHFPFRYEQGGSESTVAGLAAGQEASIIGTLEKLETKKSWRRKIPVSEGYIRDATGRIKCRWFNQPYIAKMYSEGVVVKATGKVSGSGEKLYLANPQLQKISPTETGLFASQEHSSKKSSGRPSSSTRIFSQNVPAAPGLFAIYPESRGISSLWFRSAIKKLLWSIKDDTLHKDPVPADMLKKYNLPTLKTALVWIHQPNEIKQAEAARKRFAFEEVFLIQLERGIQRQTAEKEKSFIVEAEVGDFVRDFPFSATSAQTRAIGAVLQDMHSGHPMGRLLEGDVGSGKTAVAATAVYAVVCTRPEGQNFGTLQAAYMAPTEILAKQHFDSFIKFFERHPINIGLITGSGCYKFPSKVSRDKITNISRAQLLKWVAGGEIPILLGTHALIQKSVQFKHLALVIIDEQHRFGTNQRRKLARKEKRLPHLLSMTATPIPRTLALTIYGDLDLTLLDEMPPGRKPVITEIVAPKKREGAYKKMREDLAEGRQAYVICPRIEEPDTEKAFALQAKSVKEEAKRLKKEIFSEYEIGILHSKLKTKEKDEIMQKFANKEIDILVATSVVEVGVNVPNATMIFIEGAERFGLAQLHQLRGRVVRSEHQAYCFVCPESRGEQTLARLKALTAAKNGFELAEQDLLQRGAGTLAGGKQWGISDVGMEALKNLKLVEAARAEALEMIKKDPALSRHLLLAEVLQNRDQQLHFE
ncbi:MAG: ATP-dependent DNA helicase RecG [Candidatus Adlerbacteria bacterium GW2011_GWA2_54_12]|uniref:ATP-dependent DNA helicase RecG n=2 Tax=Candidatus Adleribacteriota TaxID=1752736 RepID=A0A0G2ASA1_9BACT|nr:MAG: ATP-dependent DNA helicase RecG [Candidatus Adlerbacteria bacterium GW2011_GWA1_54_10]KKW36152.1 MAG: ATP-dependent DNA helicase RecG [Candidatus Adlerbacteria bacterium GW2011_GWA2_54_12]KKW37394.1 MAG: ATP-dependent DNA helicase RecG [Candidatus Adlerbacteria bacterium GW2011_GWB1_54_7]